MNVIDRLFIATNVEAIEMADNADRALCRFEFFEIIVRIAIAKFIENGHCQTVSAAVEMFLENYLMRFRAEKLEGQPWRDFDLWTIEIDAFYKANMKNILKLFNLLSSHVHKKYLMLDDVKLIVDKCP